MQFQFNSDYPALPEAKDPQDFPPAQPIPCARITTRIFHPARNQVATVQNVLVRTVPLSLRQSFLTGNTNTNTRNSTNTMNMNMHDGDSSSDDLSSSSDESMGMGGDPNSTTKTSTSIDNQRRSSHYTASFNSLSLSHQEHLALLEETEDTAYWVQRTIREAIYGRVLFAIVLKRRTPPTPSTPTTTSTNDNAEWEVTNQHCAVKEMSWQHIRRERDRLAEDPIKEVSAMQYIRRWHRFTKQQTMASTTSQQQQQQQQPLSSSVSSWTVDSVTESFAAILDTNIMMPLDLLSDDRHLYSIMPYCDGGELFERLDLNERFTEQEARYWMFQVLNVRDG